MKIAIAGGTGFIGRNLARALSATDNEIVILSRRTAPIAGLFKKAKYILANIHDPASLKKALPGIDIVYHLVGLIAETGELTFEKTVVGGTRNIIDACHSSGIKKIIYLSALGTVPGAVSKYFQSKWVAEEAIRNSSLEYVIFRPSVVFGPEDKFINRLITMVKFSPVAPIVGNGRSLFQPIHINDLINILINPVENIRLWGKTLEVGGPEQLEYREIIAIIKKVLNRRRLNLYIPLWIMKIGARALEMVMKRPPLTTDQLKMMEAGNICDNRELLSVMEITLTRLEVGLREYVR